MKIYTVQEIAEILGISRKTIQKYVRQGDIKAIRLGNQLRITEQAFMDFLESKTVIVKELPMETLKKK
ncbi:MAG: helix-turn-helix domain-containing protein [Clostridia bacterium]|jgi:excisionase family DNA binding protein|nr:helix-turn-helix domain-containing protein [Clostridia bacterium]